MKKKYAGKMNGMNGEGSVPLRVWYEGGRMEAPPENSTAMGLSCPPRWGTFNDTTLDLRILSTLDTTVSVSITDYKTTVTFANIYLGKATVKRLRLSYNLHNMDGLLVKFYFTQITPILGDTVVTECNTVRGPNNFSIRIG